MKNYSLTFVGLIMALAFPVLGSIGFSEACANEFVQVALAFPGIAIAWYGRFRQGDVNIFGHKG